MKKKRLQSANTFLDAAQVFTYEFTSQTQFDQGWRWGETRLLLERDQQRDQAKSKALSRAQLRHINLDFSLEQPRWLPLGWLILRQTKRKVHVWVSLPYPPSFLPLLWASVRTVFRAHADVVTMFFKFFRTHSFPIFFSYGGSAARIKKWIGDPFTGKLNRLSRWQNQNKFNINQFQFGSHFSCGFSLTPMWKCTKRLWNLYKYKIPFLKRTFVDHRV